VREIVVCYHAVSPDWDHPLALSPERLVRQIRTLMRLGRVQVTFDDAYRNIELVMDDLRKLGVPVTVFVCTTLADQDGAPLDVVEVTPAHDTDVMGLSTLSWDRLRALNSRGISLGSHTETHPHLPELGDDEILRELTTSKERIEKETGQPCRELAYPYGEHNARVRKLAREAGYDRAYGLIDADTRRIPGARVPLGDPYGQPRLLLHRGDGVARTIAKALTLGLRSPTTR
jgi:peptidoglycan/xylan/chitin deacetylase (PgdA/CDA1 family)